MSAQLHLSFHNVQPRIEHGDASRWLSVEKNQLYVTLFLKREQLLVLAEDIYRELGVERKPSAVTVPVGAVDFGEDANVEVSQ